MFLLSCKIYQNVFSLYKCELEYDKLNIFHNAGVVTDEGNLFYKAKYMNSYPYGLDLNIDQNMASAEYYKWIQKAEANSALI